MFIPSFSRIEQVTRLAIFFLLAAPVAAMAQGTPCPTDYGACFVELADGTYFSSNGKCDVVQFSIDPSMP